tara:strand:+ start:114 stop:623 length:510 start_codon:yes stop_codon:yes gene_type:complete
MKLLFENWRGYLSEDGKTIFYHSTPPWQAEEVEAKGLKTGSEGIGFSIAGTWADKIYGTRPVYLSTKPGFGGDREYEGTILEIDTTGLQLYPDLPTLVDFGAYVEEEEGMYWEYGTEPKEMKPFVDGDGMIYFEDLLTPGHPVANAVMKLTGTAVSLKDISSDRIKIIS